MLQDYQMQLMLLEQQNKKRLLMARQEQDTVDFGHTSGQFSDQQALAAATAAAVKVAGVPELAAKVVSAKATS